jgi:HEAT repeat protein
MPSGRCRIILAMRNKRLPHLILCVIVIGAILSVGNGMSLAADKAATTVKSTAFYIKVHNVREEWHLRIKAIRMLGQSGDPAASDVLMSTLYELCPAIKWNAATALGNFRDDPRVVDALIHALGDDTLYVREAAIRSLGRIGNVKAVPYLIAALSSESFAIRVDAVNALGRIGDARAVPYLRRIAKHDTDPMIRKEALAALKETRGTVARGTAPGDDSL